MQYRSASSLTNDYCGQQDTSYYQPQPPADYNQRQQYCNYRATQQAPHRTDHYKEKVNKRGVTQSRIPSSDIKNYQLSHQVMYGIIVRKNQSVHYGPSLKTETRKIPQIVTQPKLQ